MTYKGLISTLPNTTIITIKYCERQNIFCQIRKKINEPYYIKKTPNTYLEIK